MPFGTSEPYGCIRLPYRHVDASFLNGKTGPETPRKPDAGVRSDIRKHSICLPTQQLRSGLGDRTQAGTDDFRLLGLWQSGEIRAGLTVELRN